MRRLLDPAELVVPVLTAIFFALLAYNIHGMMSLATIFPYVLMIAMFVFGIGIVVVEMRAGSARSHSESDHDGASWIDAYKNPALVFTGALAYVGLIYVVGYYPATFIYTLAFIILFGNNALKAAAIATGFTACLYLIFVKLFGVGI